MAADEQVNLRVYVEALMRAYEQRLDERFHAQNEAILKAERNLDRSLTGFPQEYAKGVAVDELRRVIDQIRGDHVQRREIDEVKQRESVAAGRRSVLSVLATFAVTVTIVTAGYLIADRHSLTAEINQLEQRDQAAHINIIRLQNQIAQQRRTP